jgi:tetratricopeptide (TPR) repeat protein
MDEMRNKKLVIFTIVFLLILAFIAPILITGYSQIKKADDAMEAKDYASASGAYARAVKLLPWRSDLWEQAGIAARKQGDFVNAIIFLKRAPRLSEEGWLALGYSYFATKDLSSAQQTFQQGLTYFPSSSLYAGLALVHRNQKNWTAEREALQNQFRLEKGDVYAHYRLGLLLSVLEPEQALSELMLASSQDPEFDPAVQTLRTALNISSTQPDPSERMVTIGRALGLVREWDLALAAFKNATRTNAGNAEAWAWLGEAQQQTGQDGLAALDQALSIDQSSVIVRALRGLYWNRQEKYEQMLAEYLLAAEYEPENPAWQAAIGDAYVKLGDLAFALNAYQHATDLAPDDSTYWRLLAVFCASGGVHVEDVGLPAAHKAVELSPQDALALDALGFSYYSSARFANAEKTLLDAIALSPEYFPAHIHLAMTYLAQGDRPAAFKSLTFVHDTDTGGANGLYAGQLLKQYFP